MPITPTVGVPRSFIQGDTVSFTETLAEYPASEWSMKFCLAMSGAAITPIAATADGDTFAIMIAAADSANIAPGQYVFSEIATNLTTAERKTVKTGAIRIIPDPTATLTPSQNALILAALKNGMLKLSGGTNDRVNINGQEFTKRNIKDLQEIIDRYQVIVDGELRALGLSTKGGSKIIQSTFCP